MWEEPGWSGMRGSLFFSWNQGCRSNTSIRSRSLVVLNQTQPCPWASSPTTIHCPVASSSSGSSHPLSWAGVKAQLPGGTRDAAGWAFMLFLGFHCTFLLGLPLISPWPRSSCHGWRWHVGLVGGTSVLKGSERSSAPRSTASPSEGEEAAAFLLLPYLPF